MPTKDDIQRLVHLIEEKSPRLTPDPPSPAMIGPELLNRANKAITHPIRAVLFDVYGTLFVSGSGDVGSALNKSRPEPFEKAYKQTGWEIINQAEFSSHAPERFFELIQEEHERLKLSGNTAPEVDIVQIFKTLTDELIRKSFISREPNANPDSDDFLLHKLSILFEILTNPAYPMPNLLNFLHQVVQKNIHFGIVSNAQFYTPLLFEAFLGRTPSLLGFDPALCIWSYRAGKAKPDPSVFDAPLFALENNYGIHPEDCLYLGNDMLNDIWSAYQNGMHTVLFAGDNRSLRTRENDERCRGLLPDSMIFNLPALLESVHFSSFQL